MRTAGMSLDLQGLLFTLMFSLDLMSPYYVQITVRSSPLLYFSESSPHPHKVSCVKLRFREASWVIQGHTAEEKQDLNPCSLPLWTLPFFVKRSTNMVITTMEPPRVFSRDTGEKWWRTSGSRYNSKWPTEAFLWWRLWKLNSFPYLIFIYLGHLHWFKKSNDSPQEK